MNLGLADKVALVTGGSKGIGEGIVRSLLNEGARVANVNRAGAEGEALRDEFATAGKDYLFVPADLSDVDNCRNAVAATVQHFGQLDIVINNAGVNDGVGLDAGPDEFSVSLKRNLIHYYAIVHHAVDELKKSRGAIVNIGSKVSVTGQGGPSGYAAAKGEVDRRSPGGFALADQAVDEIPEVSVPPMLTRLPPLSHARISEKSGQRVHLGCDQLVIDEALLVKVQRSPRPVPLLRHQAVEANLILGAQAPKVV